jgi:hypothetical protein
MTWGCCRALRAGEPGWRLRGRQGGEPAVLLWFADEAEAREMLTYLRSGLTVDESFTKMHARIDALEARRADGSTMAYRASREVIRTIRETLD